MVRFCEVEGSTIGPLAGVRLGLKDEIPVAGVPTTGGLPNADPVTPAADAAVVARALRAGAIITATTTVSFPPFVPGTQVSLDSNNATQNPIDPARSPGGSSSGSAAAVAGGVVDVALGTDWAGSVRIPSAWCGLVGLKPTTGRVSLDGCPDFATNEIGTITRTVEENALLFEAIADTPAGATYRLADARRGGVRGLRVGIIHESRREPPFGDAVTSAFDSACERLRSLGAFVERVTIPSWTLGPTIGLIVRSLERVSDADAMGLIGSRGSRIDSNMLKLRATSYADDPHLPVQRELIEHLTRRLDGTLLAGIVSLRAQLSDEIDAALTACDLLVTPTTVTSPYELTSLRIDSSTPDATDPIELATSNCEQFNLSGHPAMSIPVGDDDVGMPFGLQLVARRYREFDIFRAAFALERPEHS